MVFNNIPMLIFHDSHSKKVIHITVLISVHYSPLSIHGFIFYSPGNMYNNGFSLFLLMVCLDSQF